MKKEEDVIDITQKSKENKLLDFYIKEKKNWDATDYFLS